METRNKIDIKLVMESKLCALAQVSTDSFFIRLCGPKELFQDTHLIESVLSCIKSWNGESYCVFPYEDISKKTNMMQILKIRDGSYCMHKYYEASSK